jgi:hypothetical protein
MVIAERLRFDVRQAFYGAASGLLASRRENFSIDTEYSPVVAL